MQNLGIVLASYVALDGEGYEHAQKCYLAESEIDQSMVLTNHDSVKAYPSLSYLHMYDSDVMFSRGPNAASLMLKLATLTVHVCLEKIAPPNV